MPIRSVSIAAPSFGGGGMVRVAFLADLLRHLGVAVEVVAHLPEGREVYPSAPAELALTTVAGRRIWHYARRYMKQLSGDAIIAVKPRTSSFCTALLAGLKSRRPLVLDMDDWELSSRAGGLSTRAKVALLERVIGLADALTVNNSSLQKRFGGTLLPSGRDGRIFDPGRFDPAECRRALGLEHRFVLMFPGTAVPHSGLEDLLTAMDFLGREELTLVVVGGRASGAEYVANRLRHWSRWIIHLPQYPPDRMPAVVAAAHLVVVPHRNMVTSRYNLPMKLLDGMAMGKPILATRVGDLPAALGGAAYLVEPSAPAEIADALAAVLADPEEVARRGSLIRERFEQKYDLDAIAPIMEQVLAGLSVS